MLLLVREMLQRYGGVQGFAESWAQQARRAMEDRPGSTPALNCFSSVANLVKHTKDARAAVKELDDKNLEDELAATVTRFIQDRPQLAVEAAKRLGWQVVPLEPSQAG